MVKVARFSKLKKSLENLENESTVLCRQNERPFRMRESLLVIATLVIGFALRSCRTLLLRKLGALSFLIASALSCYFIFGNTYAGVVGALLWFFLPWFDLLTRVRKMKHPLNNRLRFQKIPSPEYFPNAGRLITEIEDAEFEHVIDSGWNWVGMQRYYRIFWNPEVKAIAAVCLCEHENVAFAYVTISSRTENGQSIHTTNYPFSPPLRHPSLSLWRHLPCEKNRFPMIFHDHEKHLADLKVTESDLLLPDPDEVIDQMEVEMRKRIDHNSDRGIIIFTGDGHFRYTKRGLFFLWKQAVKDMIRLC